MRQNPGLPVKREPCINIEVAALTNPERRMSAPMDKHTHIHRKAVVATMPLSQQAGSKKMISNVNGMHQIATFTLNP